MFAETKIFRADDAQKRGKAKSFQNQTLAETTDRSLRCKLNFNALDSNKTLDFTGRSRVVNNSLIRDNMLSSSHLGDCSTKNHRAILIALGDWNFEKKLNHRPEVTIASRSITMASVSSETVGSWKRKGYDVEFSCWSANGGCNVAFGRCYSSVTWQGE